MAVTASGKAAYRLPPVLPHGVVMTNEPDLEINRELIQLLCLEAGRIMEDTSAELALILPDQPELITARVAKFRHAALQITAMANAASALVHGYQPTGE